MRIALISYDFGEYCVRHTNALADHGEVMLLVARDLAEPFECLLDGRAHYRPFEKPRLRQPIQQLARVRQIVRQVSRFEPDVVHLQLGQLWFNFALPLLRRYPLVLTIHDPRHHLGDAGARNTPQRILDFGYRRADQVIVHGKALKELVHREIGVELARIHVVPHIALGLDSAPSEASASVGQGDEPPRLLFFGRLWEYKGLDYLIRAQPAISERFPDARIVIAGRGEDFGRYRQAMRDPSFFEVYNRWVSHEERARLFEEATVVVLPYVEATQSGVVPIAYAHRKPVVATLTGGLPDSVEHGVTGLLVPPRDEHALADAVCRLLADSGERRRMGEAGRRKLDVEC
ncbi:MAG: glycosyltransferase family 4 protein, partial [Gaiellaceae bacterium]